MNTDQRTVYLSVQDVAARLTPTGREVDTDKVYKWARQGIKVGGRRVVLQGIRLPHGLAFTAEAVERFVRELTAAEGLCADVSQPEPQGEISTPEPSQLPTFGPNEIGTYPRR